MVSTLEKLYCVLQKFRLIQENVKICWTKALFLLFLYSSRKCKMTNFLILNKHGPLHNTVHYNKALDITLITVGPQLDCFCYMSIYFTLVITRIG